MDPVLALAGFGVGIVVGLTGMGGGALMTPILVLLFGVPPVAAVSSDLAASAVMKPFGGWVHLRRGTVRWPLVGWLCVGSVPSAFLGVRPLPTALLGAAGGLVVGLTSVGSGSLIIVVLLALYPALRANDLVGTDLVQAIPLVAAAALGHALFGDLHLDIAAAVLVGSIPGVLVGARLSSRAPAGFVRSALVVVLLASALKLLGLGNVSVAAAASAATVLAVAVSLYGRRVAVRRGVRRTPEPVAAPPS